MPLLFRLALALGLAVVAPAVAFADLPKAVWAENVNPGRDELLRNIRGIRSILQQIRRERFCGPLEELESMEQELRKLESAYIRGRPVTIKAPPPDKGRAKN